MMTDKLELVENRIIRPVKGSIVMVHLDFGKRSSKFDKRRRVYEDLGLVIDNDSNGNIRLVLLTRFSEKNKNGLLMNSYFDKPLDVPTFAVKQIAPSYVKMLEDKSVIDTFNFKESMRLKFEKKLKTLSLI